MQQFLSPNTKSLSIVVAPSAGSTKASYNFPTQEDLQNRKIIAIEAYCGEIDCIYDPNNSGTKTLPPSLFMGATLTLYNAAVTNKNMTNAKQEAGEFYDQIPLSRFRAVTNPTTAGGPQPSAGPGVFVIRPTEINWTKSKINFATPIDFDETYAATFVVHYLDEGDDGTWFMRAMGFMPPAQGQVFNR